MKVSLVLLFFCTSMALSAQQRMLIKSGSIEFEKRVNRYAIFQKAGMPEDWFEDYKDRNEQFFMSKSILLFSTGKTSFSPLKGPDETQMISSADPFPFSGQNNTIYTDLSKGYSISQTKIYGQELLIKDSLHHIKWKLTDEFREVAGYPCRRANGLMLDSVYVVAFYTNEIHYSGGPESFTGLPGMILEVFLPHDNVSWKALKVNAEVVPKEQMVPPSAKSKAMNRRELIEWATTSLKNVNTSLRNLLIKGLLI